MFEKKALSLGDILTFLKNFWKLIVFSGILGLIFAFIYLLITPKQFEASTLIRMSQSLTSSPPTDIEQPAELIYRMSSATSFPDSVISACGADGNADVGTSLHKAIKFQIPKGVASVVELKVFRANPETAKACAMSVFDEIVTSQASLGRINFNMAALKLRLTLVEERLAQDKALLSKFDLSNKGATVPPIYYSILANTRALEDERTKLIASTSGELIIPTKMQFPVNVGSESTYPKRVKSLVIGFFSGIFIGFIFAIGLLLATQFKLILSKSKNI